MFYREKDNLYCEDPAYDRGFDRVEVGRYEAKDNGTILGRLANLVLSGACRWHFKRLM